MWLHFGGEVRHNLRLSFLRYVPETAMMQARMLVLHNQIFIFEMHTYLRIFYFAVDFNMTIQYDI
jgi:hypothetical protein